MKKTLLFLSMFAWLWVGMACSGNDDDNPRMAPLPQYQFRGDYVTDTWNNIGIIHHCADSPKSLYYYIEDTQNRRYYINLNCTTEYQPITELLIEGIKVKFSGKIYTLNEKWYRSAPNLAEIQNEIEMYGLFWNTYQIERIEDNEASEEE